MDKIAYISGGVCVYWTSIILTLAAGVAICFFLAFYLHKSGNAAAGFGAIPLALLLSLVLARFFHWYCLPDRYDSFLAAMTDFSSGGYSLLGVFLGCFLTAVLLRLVGLHRNLKEMIDCMCLAAAAGLSVGRLNSFFNTTARGRVLESITSLPFAYPVTNVVSGATEYRLATFVIQAMVAALLFVGLTAFYITGARRASRKDGDLTLMFLLCYGATQVVLDSTRYDSLFPRINGFVSVVQALSAVALVAVIVIFSVRLVKAGGFRWWYPFMWLAIAGCIGGAGYMEYHVQRHGSEAIFAYSVMSICLAAIVLITMLIWTMAEEARQALPDPME